MVCAGSARSCSDPIYGVLGNHDSIAFVTEFEAMGIRMLMNESVMLERGDARLALVGIDDHHFYRLGSIPKATADVPEGLPSILLSHAPEVYRQAAQAGFDVMLCGHTHGGQICLPGGYPATIDADVPRRMGRGAWRRRGMLGYTSPGAGTSIVDVRINCPPEITLHRLRCALKNQDPGSAHQPRIRHGQPPAHRSTHRRLRFRRAGDVALSRRRRTARDGARQSRSDPVRRRGQARASAILEAYSRCGFYVFEGVLKQDELADIERDVADMLARAPVTRGAIGRMRRAVLLSAPIAARRTSAG